jgi:hypothetical protein
MRGDAKALRKRGQDDAQRDASDIDSIGGWRCHDSRHCPRRSVRLRLVRPGQGCRDSGRLFLSDLRPMHGVSVRARPLLQYQPARRIRAAAAWTVLPELLKRRRLAAGRALYGMVSTATDRLASAAPAWADNRPGVLTAEISQRVFRSSPAPGCSVPIRRSHHVK